METRQGQKFPRLSSVVTPAAYPDEQLLQDELQAALAPSFVLVRRLGAGGMGSVYLGRDPVLKRDVAVKVLAPALANDEAACARFQREAQAVAAISHPNVVAVYSVGKVASGVPYFVMQYVGGRTIAERLASEGPVDVGAGARILGEVAAALAAAHAKGIIHRDIKPANILWDEDTGRALVSDFGIAAVLEQGSEGDSTRITHTGMVVGTPAYMSPEQLLAEAVSEKTDIYSLGLLGYELLAGEGPYAITSEREVLAAHLRDTPRKLSSLRPEVDTELEALLEACLAKDPAMRPSASEVARRLVHGAGVLLEWPPPGLEDLRGKASGVVALLALGGATVVAPLLLITLMDGGAASSLALASVASVGILLLLSGTALMARRLVAATRAVRAGYGWATVAEAMTDRRGDTGSVMTGAREYAALSASARNRIRRNRLIAAGSTALAASWPPFGFLLALMTFGAGPGASTAVVAMTVGLPLALYGGAMALRMHERLALRLARGQRRRPVRTRDALARLINAWRESFEQVRAGQGIGSGWRGRTALVFVAVLATGVVVGTGAMAFGMTALSLAAQIHFEVVVPSIGATQERFRRIERLHAYRLPPDPSVTPLRAGEAMYALAGPSRVGRVDSTLWRPRTSADPLSSYRGLDRAGEARFPQLFESGFSSAIQQARNGFTAEQRQLLRELAAYPGIEEFSLLARASAVDLAGAAYALPLPAYWNLPIVSYTDIRAAANARLAQAALDLEARRPADAERTIREVVSVGFLMTEGNFLIENLIGIVIVGNARTALAALFEGTGRSSEAVAIGAGSDPDVEEARLSRPRGREQVAFMRALLPDSTQLRGLRWEFALGTLPFAPCSDPRQLIIGPEPGYAQTFAVARRHLTRFASDSLMLDRAERTLDEPIPHPKRASIPARGVHLLAVAADRVVGGRRFEACVNPLLHRSGRI